MRYLTRALVSVHLLGNAAMARVGVRACVRVGVRACVRVGVRARVGASAKDRQTQKNRIIRSGFFVSV